MDQQLVSVWLLFSGIQTASILVMAFFFIRLFYSFDALMAAVFALLPKTIEVIKLDDDGDLVSERHEQKATTQ